MRQASQFTRLTIPAAQVIPLDLHGVKEVHIWIEQASARVYPNKSASGDHFPLDAAWALPIIVNSNDGYLYLRNENQAGGGNDSILSFWMVY